jgi:cytochrome b561
MSTTILHYAPLAKLLHWTVAACVAVMIPIGIVMGKLAGGPLQNVLFDLHRSLGVLVLVLMLVRLVTRLVLPPPPLDPSIPPLQRRAADAMHKSLYVLLFVQILLGLTATSAYGAPINVFWLFSLAPFGAKDAVLAGWLYAAHALVGVLLAIMLSAHVGAALYHHFIRRDDTLRRMLPAL